VVLACTRLVARFIAEAPEAVDAQLLDALPVMLFADKTREACAGGGETAVTASCLSIESAQDLALEFLMPGLLQVCTSLFP
jgi:hypothetical protein